MKRELHTLYIKHDANFKTLSKISLAQLILQIIHRKHDGCRLRQILDELSKVLSSNINRGDVDNALLLLSKEKKVRVKGEKYFIHTEYLETMNVALAQSELLHDRVLKKYFEKAETHPEVIKIWFQDTTIKFFERFSFEWFYQKTTMHGNGKKTVTNLTDVLDETLIGAKNIIEADKDWLKSQYLKFIECDEQDEALLFWHYGIAMLSSRLITARNYADKISIEMFKGSKFVLDTNILMILDLEAHQLNESLEALEKVLVTLEITPVYFNCTRDEYVRAMDARRQATSSVFANYDIKVLTASDCPFIQTALRRGCRTAADVDRMFEPLLDIPSKFNDSLDVVQLDYRELSDAIEEGKKNEQLKEKINEIYKKRTKREKREKPKSHDAGIVSGAHFVRKAEKCWIITSDGSLKLYAIENCLRDENEIAVGLDVVLGLMAVSSGGVHVDASNFAPLFKSLVKLSLLPESDAFEVRDLAFMLSTNTRIQDLPPERVMEVAKEVKRMRVAGNPEEVVALFLRRVIEGDKLSLGKDIQEANENLGIEKAKREKVEEENKIWAANYRNRRRGELRDKYDKELRNRRIGLVAIPVVISLIMYIILKYFVQDPSPVSQFVVSIATGVVFAIISLFPLNKRLKRRYSEYVTNIDVTIEKEIIELRKKAE